MGWSSMGRHSGRVGWFRVGAFEVTTTALLVAVGALSMVLWAISPAVLEPIYLNAPLVREGEVWRLATWPLGEAPSIWGVIGLAFFWFVGHMVEDRTSRGRYAALIGAMTILPATVVSLTEATARSGVATGLSLLGLAFLVVIAVDNPSMPMLFGIPIWVVAAVIVGINSLSYLGLRLWGTLLLMLLVIAIGVLGSAALNVIQYQLAWVPRLKDGPGPRSRGARRGRARGRRKGPKVVEGPWASPGGFAPSPHSRADAAELDALLDKISASGVGSLTPAERARLEALSRGLRDD